MSETSTSSLSDRQIRILKISIVIMTALLILGIAALIFGMARQAARIGAKPALSKSSVDIAYTKQISLGQGEMQSIIPSDGVVIVTWKGPKADTILTLDPRTGKEKGRFVLTRY